MPTRDLPVFTDSFTQTERVKSLIPVLPWQDGFSYYNNYSSKFPGELPIRPPRQITAQEAFDFTDRNITERLRDLPSQRDTAGLRETSARGGRTGVAASDTAELTDRDLGRHGLWSIPAPSDPLRVDDSPEGPHGRRVWSQADQVTVSDSLVPFQFTYTDRVSLFDSAEQHGLRLQPASDNVFSIDYYLTVRGRRSFVVSDDVAVTDLRGALNGIRSTARSDEPVTVTDGGWRRGRWAIYDTDAAGVADLGYQRGGLRQQRVRDDLLVTDGGVRVSANENDAVRMADSGVQSGQRAFRVTETVGGVETIGLMRAVVNDAASLTETVTLVGDVRQDAVTLSDRSWSERSLLRRDDVTLTDTGAASVSAWKGGEVVGFTESWRAVNVFFKGSDLARLGESHLLLRESSRSASEYLTVTDSGAFRPGSAWGLDTAGLGDQTQILRIAPRAAADVTTLSDSGAQRGRRQWLLGESFLAVDSAIRVTVRQPSADDAGTVTDSGRQSGLRSYRESIPASVGDDFLVTKVRNVVLDDTSVLRETRQTNLQFTRRDDVFVTDPQNVGAYRSEFGRSDAVVLGEEPKRDLVSFTVRDVTVLSEDPDLHGRLQFLDQERVSVGTAHRMVNTTPRDRDEIRESDEHLRVTGRRRQIAGDEAELSESHGGVHGRRAPRAADYVFTEERKLNPARSITGGEIIYLGERVDGGEKAKSDPVYLSDWGALDPVDTGTAVTLEESYHLNNQTPRALERVTVADRRSESTTDRSQNDRVTLARESRIVTREFLLGEALNMGDHKYVKLNKNDFLEIRPNMIQERPRRRRGDLQMMPGSALGVVYAEGEMAHRATGVYPDSWKGHARSLVGELPRGATHVSGSAADWAYHHAGRVHVRDQVFAGLDPLMIGTELYYLSPDRLKLLRRSAADGFSHETYLTELPRTGFIKQRTATGPLVHDRLDRAMYGTELNNAGPQDRGAVVWAVQGIRTDVPPIIPLEGAVLAEQER